MVIRLRSVPAAFFVHRSVPVVLQVRWQGISEVTASR